MIMLENSLKRIFRQVSLLVNVFCRNTSYLLDVNSTTDTCWKDMKFTHKDHIWICFWRKPVVNILLLHWETNVGDWGFKGAEDLPNYPNTINFLFLLFQYLATLFSYKVIHLFFKKPNRNQPSKDKNSNKKTARIGKKHRDSTAYFTHGTFPRRKVRFPQHSIPARGLHQTFVNKTSSYRTPPY